VQEKELPANMRGQDINESNNEIEEIFL